MKQDTSKRHKKNLALARPPTPHQQTKASHFCGQREGASGSTGEGSWPRAFSPAPEG